MNIDKALPARRLATMAWANPLNFLKSKLAIAQFAPVVGVNDPENSSVERNKLNGANAFRVSRHSESRRFVMLLLAAMASQPVLAQNEDVITVGNGGTAANCTRATLESAIALAASIPGPNRIWLSRNTNNGYYLLNNAATIDNQDLEIVGGLDDCFDTTPSGHTDVSGSGGVQDPVFRIRGGGVVRLAYLTITLGDADNNEGGGIDYQGHGSLELLHTNVEYNYSSNGGGIKFTQPGGAAYLSLEDTIIAHNTAHQSGGGIYAAAIGNIPPVTVVFGNDVRIEDNVASNYGGGINLFRATLSMLAHRNAIQRNEALDSGGGLYVGYNSVANIGAAPVVPGAALFYQNSAKIGGAIATDESLRLSIYSTTPHQPVLFSENHAEFYGGALSIRNESLACLKNVSMNSNNAFIGGGAVDIQAAQLFWNTGCFSPAESEVPCTPGDGCNLIDRNVTATDRGIIDINSEASRVLIKRVSLIENTGGSAILVGGANSAPSKFDLRDSVVARNNLRSAIYVLPGVTPQGSGIVVAEGITVTGNNLTQQASLFPEVFDIAPTASFTLRNAIIHQPGSFPLKANVAAHVLQRVMTTANYNSPLTPTNEYFQATPIFIGNTADRYIQSPDSRGVDAAPAAGGVDIEGNPRDQNVPNVSNGSGPRDLGAFETSAEVLPSDVLLRDSFEDRVNR